MARPPSNRSVAIALLLAFAPLILLSETKEQLYLLSLSITGTLAGVFLLWHGNEPQESNVIPWGRWANFAAIQIGLLFVLKAFSTMPMVSYWFAWIIGLLPIAYLFGRQISTQNELYVQAWDCLAAVGVVAATWGCIQYIAGFRGRASGPFLDFNSYGALLYVFLIPAIGFLFDPEISRKKRRIYAAGIAIGLFALFATYSRGAIGVTLLMTAVVFISFKHAGLKITKPASVIVVIGLASYIAVKLCAHTPISRTFALASDPSTQFRLMMWKSAWQAWLDHPVLGTGLGTYQLQYLHYRLPTETNTSGSLAHNDYVQMLMEGGPLMLAFLLGWGLFSLWLFARLWRSAGDTEKSTIERLRAAKALSLVLAVLGLFMHAAVNFIFYVGSLSMIAGLYLAHAHFVAGAPPSRSIHLPIRKSILNFVFAAISIFAVGGLLIDWVGGQAFNPQTPDAFLSAADKPPEDRYRTAGLVATLRPDHVAAHQAMAVAATDIAMAHRNTAVGEEWAQRALDETKNWIDVSQGNPYPYQVAGQLLWNFPALRSYMAPLADRPDALLLTAIDRYPAQPDSYLILARFWTSQNQPEQALRVLGSALPWVRIPITTETAAKSWLALIDEGRKLGDQLGKAPNSSEEMRTIANDFDQAHF